MVEIAGREGGELRGKPKGRSMAELEGGRVVEPCHLLL